MKRSLFQSAFSVGFLIVLVVENPWFRISAFLSKPSRTPVELTAQFWVAVLASAFLVVVAGVRGQSIDRPYLFLLPMLAFAISGMSFLKAFVPIDGLVLTGVIGPVLANLICYFLGSSVKGRKDA